jgi:hypothetical protein
MEACEIGLGDHWTASFDMAVLFLVEGTSLPGVAKVLVAEPVALPLFTWFPSDTGVPAW